MNRRRFLAFGTAIGMGCLSGCTFESEQESRVVAEVEIGLETVLEGVTFPIAMAFLPNGDRLVCERPGRILRHTDDGLADEPFLDLEDRILDADQEKGVLGLELHPEFSDTRTLYVRYSAPPDDSVSGREYSHTAVVSEFEATADLTGVVPGSERVVLEIPQPGPYHNAGDLAFGPDGYLYVAAGDGQRTDLGDEGWSWWYEQGQASQDTANNVLGGILRIDVDNPTGDEEYAIPSDNPLVGEAGRDEYYAWGLRNPNRISFDDDRLFVADVGEHTAESVYLVERGANYGWPIVEGSSCSPTTSIDHSLAEDRVNAFNPKTWQALTNRISPYKTCPTPDRVDDSFHDPVVEYHRSGARAIVGGYVYRGDDVPELRGRYLFGDFVTPSPIFATSAETDEEPWPIAELVISDTDHGRLDDVLISFARDPDGEVYVLTNGAGDEAGRISRIVAAE